MRTAVLGACLVAGGAVGMFGATYYVLLATDTPGSWLQRHTRPH